MKLMFNEIGGQQVLSNVDDCFNCVFHHREWCYSIDIGHPLYRWCGNEIYVEAPLDIFNL